MQKRGAIGLSMNMIVVLIISIVVLSGGIALLYQFIGGAQDIKASLDERTEQQLERLLIDQGKRVALPLHVETLDRGDSHVFGIGILNIDESLGTEFTIQVTPDTTYIDEELTPQPTTDIDLNEWLLYNAEAITIAENEHITEGILVTVPRSAARGSYTFTARVFTQANTPYGNPQKFTVQVN